MPVRSMPGAPSGVARLGTTHPALPALAPLPTAARSSRVTSASRSARLTAQHKPITPPPITTTFMA